MFFRRQHHQFAIKMATETREQPKEDQLVGGILSPNSKGSCEMELQIASLKNAI